MILRRSFLPCSPVPLRFHTVHPLKNEIKQIRHRHPPPRSAPDDHYNDGGDYYSILGVSPSATSQEIKQAYRQLMKFHHPDQSTDEESNEFAMFCNQIYETLMDPDSRAEYDAIAGFTIAAINPFMDASYALEFAFVDEFTCIGCRNCNNVCPMTFEMEEEYGRARVYRQGVDPLDKIQEAIDTCPVSCIHLVSAPQLKLLEETMATMERIDSWILMNGGGKGANLNVFSEASIAWEKRKQEAIMREEKAKWTVWSNNNFSPAAGSKMQGSATSGTTVSDEEDWRSTRRGRQVSAAAMAAAARRWRDFQRAKRQKEQKLLSG